MKKIWIAVIKLLGWRMLLPDEGTRPELKRCVFVVAPHTSISDFLVGAAYLWALDVNGHVFIKKEFFRPPLGRLLRHLGAIPIDRGNRHNDMIGMAVREFEKGETFSLAITPEGTRKPTARWKRGFWEIAHRSGVPIVPAYVDFGKKEIGLGASKMTTESFEDDLREIRSFFKKSMAKHPENFIEISGTTEKESRI